VGDDQLFYLMSRGLSESQAMGNDRETASSSPITPPPRMEYASSGAASSKLQMGRLPSADPLGRGASDPPWQ